MSRALITESYLTDIANAIRAKNGSSDTYTPPQMAAAIEAIPTGGITPTGTKQITQNGTHDVTQYASANVNVQPNLQSKTATVNGTVTPDQGYDGLSSVIVNVESGGISGVYKSSGAPASSLGNDGDIYIRTYDLPSNVNFVEYLQGDGNAYIDTGIIADENTGAYAKFEVTGGYPVFSARYSAASRTYGIICVDSGATLSLDMDTVRTQSPTAIGNVVEAKMNRFIKEKNGATIGITNPASFTTPANVTLFAINATNSYGLVVSPSKIHRVVFTQNGVVTHDFLPALDGNGVACMYESISGTYFYNTAASGSFSSGNTVTPEAAEPTIYTKVNGAWKVVTQIGAV